MTRTTKTILTAIAVSLVGGPLAAQETFVINSFGGAYEEAHRRLVIEPFEQMYNVEVEVVTAYSADALAQLRAQADNPQFDVIHFSGGQEVTAAAEGLLAPIMPDQLSHYDELYPFAVEGIESGQGPVYSVAVLGLLGDGEVAPTSWNDLFTADNGEDVAIADISNTYGLLTLLMLNQIRGGSLDDIQPGLDAVTELLDGGAQILSSSPEFQQAFAQGATSLAAYAQDYAYTLQQAGLPISFVQPAEGSPGIYITANVVAGRPNEELARAFVDMSISAAAQAGWAEALRYSPTNRTVELPVDLAGQVVFGDEAAANLVRFDPVVVNDRRSDWTDAWNRAIAQ